MAPKKALNEVTLSSGIKIVLNDLPAQAQQNLILSLTRSQLVTEDGSTIDPNAIDDMSDAARLQLITGIMDIVDTILVEDGVLDVKLPKDGKWLRKLMRKSYVRESLQYEDLKDVYNDEDLQKFLYVRYVGIQNDDDFNMILNATLMKGIEVEGEEIPVEK